MGWSMGAYSRGALIGRGALNRGIRVATWFSLIFVLFFGNILKTKSIKKTFTHNMDPNISN